MPTAELRNPTASAADAPTLRLRLQREGASAETFVFHQAEIQIGRRPRGEARATVDLELPHRDVSRRQCRIFFQGARLFLEDLGSAGGTMRNGKPLQGAEPLAAGDEFSFGGYRASVEVLALGGLRGPMPSPSPSPSPSRAPLRAVESASSVDASTKEGSKAKPAASTAAIDAGLSAEAEAWWRLGEPSALLLRGRALRRAKRWLAAHVEIHPDDRRRRHVLASTRAATKRRWHALGSASAALATVLLATWLCEDTSTPRIVDHERAAISCTRDRVDAAQAALADDGRSDLGDRGLLRAAAALRWLADGQCRTTDADVALDRALIARHDAVLATLPGAIVGITPILGDRDRVIVEGRDGALHLRDPATPGLTLAVDPDFGAGPWVHSGDGGWWARVDGQGRVDVWTALREPARVASLAAVGAVRAMAFDRGGHRLVIAADDGLTVWERDGPRWEAKARRPQTIAIPADASMSIAGDGVIVRRGAHAWWHPLVDGPASQELASDVTAILADGPPAGLVADGRGHVRRLRGRGRRITFEPVVDVDSSIVGLHRLAGGDQVLVVGRDGSLVVVDPEQRWRPGEAVSRRLLGAEEAPRAIASDARWIVAWVGDRLLLWDRSGLHHERGPIVEFTADLTEGATLAVVDDAILSGDTSGALRRWSILGADAGLAGDLVTLEAQVDLAAIGGGGRWVAASGDDRRVHVWRRDPATSPIAVGSVALGDDVAGLAIDPRGHWLAIAHDRTLEVWALGERLAEAPRGRVTVGAPITRVTLTADGRWLVVGDARGGVSGWPLTDEGISGAPTLAFSHDDAITTLVPVPGEAAIVSGDRRGALVLSRPGGGARRRLGGHSRAIVAAAVDPQGQWLATSADDGQIRIARLADGAEARTLPHPGARALAFAADGLGLVSGDDRGELWLHALQGGDRRRLGSHGPGTRVRAVAFDGENRLVSAGSDGALRLWELRRGVRFGVREARALPGHTGAIRALARDGGVVVTGGEDGALRIWSLAADERVARACRIAGHGADPADFAGVLPAEFVRGLCG